MLCVKKMIEKLKPKPSHVLTFLRTCLIFPVIHL